ncbi:HPr family phosphocarrier protein [Candidatus Sumerlaeota bacterium]|nr:HPr family phosphocarrier protein [Candidatus Sumerlaeales bacterium]MDD4280567.1 HPr family phosphocarrier protein [Candidatus Sumerlaeales bacterium]NLD61391.1 HPr family phosphocarrier protein [Candidatus Sumerlaeota bacterium]
MEVVKKDIEILNDAGLHLRPAAMFVQTANKYKNCNIFVIRDSMRVNGKSIMGLVMLAASKGTILTIECSGEECEKALDDLCTVAANRFGM